MSRCNISQFTAVKVMKNVTPETFQKRLLTVSVATSRVRRHNIRCFVSGMEIQIFATAFTDLSKNFINAEWHLI